MPTPAEESLAGAWQITSGSSVASTVSGGIGPFQSDVTARTTAVDGAAEVRADGTANVLTASHFTVDATQLTTGDGILDDQMRSIMETERYPTSQFEQTGTAEMPAASGLRAGAQITLRGNLTLHGVTRPAAVQAQVTLAGGELTLVASVPFRLADYNIHGDGLISLGDTGTMSFRIVLTR